jgi:hypothetical protein
MLRQHVRCHRFTYPLHEPGEVVYASIQSYDHRVHGFCPKLRPVILLRCGDPEHWIVSTTTRPRCDKTGRCRPALPDAACLGLDKPSFLWDTPDQYVSRIDVRQHFGWINREVVTLLVDCLPLDRFTQAVLWRAATIHGDNTPRQPR